MNHNYNVKALQEAKRSIDDRLVQMKEIERISKERLEQMEASDDSEQQSEEEERVIDVIMSKIKQQIEDFQKEKEVKNKKKQSQNRKNQIIRGINQLTKHLEILKTIKSAYDYNLIDEDELKELEDQLDSFGSVKDLTRDNTFEIYQPFDIPTLESQIKDEEEEIRNRKDREKNEESRSKTTSITPLSTNVQEDQQGGLILTPLNQQPNSSSSSATSSAPIVGNSVNPSLFYSVLRYSLCNNLI